MFAYGANMHQADMLSRAPHSVFLGTAQLNNWRIGVTSSGWLGVAPDQESFVWGALYQLGPGDEARLDEYEAVDRGLYSKSELKTCGSDPALNALVYVPNEPLDGIVREEYLTQCISAAQEIGLPEEWIQELESLSSVQG